MSDLSAGSSTFVPSDLVTFAGQGAGNEIVDNLVFFSRMRSRLAAFSFTIHETQGLYNLKLEQKYLFSQMFH